MNRNHFSKIMSDKSDNELQNIISENSPYTEDAINAAFWEIEKRVNKNSNDPLSENKQDVLIDKNEFEQEDNYSYFESEKYIFDDPALPELYTKNFILFISFLFGILFGSIFLMSNLRTIGLRKKGYIVLIFGILMTILIIFTFQFFKNMFLSFIINMIGLILINGFFWDNYIGKDFKHRRKKIIFI